MKLGAIADLHLGAGSDFGRQPFGPESRLADQERVWLAACELFVNEDVNAVLFAGDAFHRRRPSPSEILAFRAGLDVLFRHDIPVIAVDGNHSVVSADLPSALSIFEGELALSRTPEMIPLDGVTICTLPWTPPVRLVAQAGGGDRDSLHTEAAALLVDVARGLRAQCPGGKPAILLAHWSVSGASIPSGLLADQLREPVLPLHDLEMLGFDKVILGHLHKPQVLDERRRILYTGSPAVVDYGEADTKHGVWILDTDRHPSQGDRFVSLDDRPFLTVEADLSKLSADDDLTGVLIGYAGMHPQGLEGAAVRVRYTATQEQARIVDHERIRRALADAGVWKLYAIQPDIVRADRARVEGLTEDVAPMDALELWIGTQEGLTPELAQAMRERTARYLEAVGA